MQISIYDKQRDLSVQLSQIEEIVKAVVSFEKKQYDEVSIHLLTTSEMAELHGQYFNDPTPTDTISFPIDQVEGEINGPYRVLGDAFVCPAVAIEYANEHHLSPHDELTLYLVHSLLHLLGYKDLTGEEQSEMRSAEKRHLLNLQSLSIQLTPKAS